MASQLAYPLSHSGDAHAALTGGGLEATQMFGCDAFAVVGDLELKNVIVPIKAHCRGGCAGVSMNVSKAFLQNAEEHEFAVFGRAFHALLNIALQVDPAALGESFCKPACSRRDTSLVE